MLLLLSSVASVDYGVNCCCCCRLLLFVGVVVVCVMLRVVVADVR